MDPARLVSDQPDAHHLDALISEFTAVFQQTTADGTPRFSEAEIDRVYPLLLFKAVSLAGIEALDEGQQADLGAVLTILGLDETSSELAVAAALTDYAMALGHSALLDEVEAVFERHGQRLNEEHQGRVEGEFRKLTGQEKDLAPHLDEEAPEDAESARALGLKNVGRLKI